MNGGLTDGELTVLGLLAEEPRHGYDLDRVIEQRGIRAWTSLGFSSIYYLLDRLAGQGLIAVTAQGEGRRRAVYRLTPAGDERLAAQSADALDSLTPVRARVLIGMANSPVLDTAEMTQRLENRVERLSAELQALRRRRAEQQPLPDHAQAIFAYGEAMILADAKKAGLDVKKLQADMASPAIAQTLAESHDFAKKAGLDGTPTFIINGVMYPGAMDEGGFNTAFKKS